MNVQKKDIVHLPWLINLCLRIITNYIYLYTVHDVEALPAESLGLRKKCAHALRPGVPVAFAVHAKVEKPEVACARVAEQGRRCEGTKLVVRHWIHLTAFYQISCCVFKCQLYTRDASCTEPSWWEFIC